MPLPIRHLPVWQNWDCQGCGNCCRDYQVAVSDDERRRIQDQGWEDEAALAGQPLFVQQGRWWHRRWRLNHGKDGTCIFLNEQGRCRIHEKFGGEAKPLACRLYPFILVPAKDQWQVGLRYACPTAAANQGRPLSEQRLDHYAAELEKQTGVDAAKVPPPALQAGQRVDWPDLLRFRQALVDLLRDRRHRIGQRLRLCLALARTCRQARFDQVTGNRLTEFLRVVASGLEGDVPTSLPAPTWIGGVLFRQALALYVRKDQGQDSGLVRRTRWNLLKAAWSFARGRGPVPRLHAWIPEITFEAIEERGSGLDEGEEAALERYYTLKVESLQFCGATNFGMSFWQGFESLALTYPVILWLTRALKACPQGAALTRAIIMADHNFAFNRILGSLRQRHGLHTLVQRGELDRLIAWYTR